MRSAVKKFGNSAGVVIPKPLLAEIGAKAGDGVELTVEQGRIVIQRVQEQARAGWAQDAQSLAAVGDDALAWPEFGNADDTELAW
ncbi:AbrB/MazE/SpoVT family DNA-binding domain-containing protein [Bosea sp. NBC_00550]|uniref:AbrB/MazE/SpoVT family DNA-binding domain-containing protein n=1 Tax=Bosea sp. NBC_00550 TaxID=2969621 RepID=UPI00222F0F6E|nr:AbrB/MazE/SpoVT family DNA-binding domain-containing protein [Bosea sp. NBC_00550]UZF95059.1 AbrB/MazE/SpoVT family DNA-binding domain-containing protein [Bosea sp. NBC_00550]